VAPQVLPGDYTLKLKVAGKEYSQPLKMVHDPSSSFTLAERELQHKTAMELYAQHEDLAKTAADISARQKTLKDNMSKVKSEKLKKDMQAYYDKLESLRAELVPTKQTSIFADENRLREDITEVYSAVCNNEQAPTNLQLDRVKELRRKVDEAARKNSEITRQYDEKIRAALTKEGLMPSEKN
jgi:ribosome-binding ATPase YchF (GTP1/OBG family)